ncbi:MAG: cysteine-rich CWC family protein [Saprospiraceae bacterium]
MKKVNANICQRCEATFACKANDITNCQCANVIISTKTQQYLSRTNYGCLCKNCLVEINQQIENGMDV